MEQHVEGGMTIPWLAASICLSRRQLERLFLEKAGVSPAKAYMRVRMERAKALLLQSKASLIDVALDVGYEMPPISRERSSAYSARRPRSVVPPGRARC